MPSSEQPTAAAFETDPEAVSVPEELDSSQAKLVYLALALRGRASVDELGESLGLRKLSLYSIIGTLREHNLVTRDGDVVTLAD